jgi:Type IV secretion system proteins
MTIRKKILMAGTCAAGLLMVATQRADAQIAVQDTAALGEWAQSIADDLKSYALQVQQLVTETQQYVGSELSWVKQSAQYVTQLQQYAQETELFLNFFHNPSLGAAGGILGSIGLGNSLPINPYALMGLMNGLEYGNGGFGQLSGLLGSLSGLAGSSYSANHVFSPTDGSWASQAMIANGNSLAGEQGAVAAAYGDLRTHAEALPALRDTLYGAQSTKDVLDGSAQVQTEIAYGVNELAQMQAASTTAQTQQNWTVQRDNERLDCDIEVFIGRGGGGCPNTATGTPGVLSAGADGGATGADLIPPPAAPPAEPADAPPSPPTTE